MASLFSSTDDLGSRIAEESLDDQVDRLIFPINVHDSLQASSGLKKGEKTGIIVSFWLFGCALLAWFLAGWLRNVVSGYYIWIVILIEVVLQLTVGMYILRFALDERTIFAELNNENASFANYFRIYREITTADSVRYPFDLLEYDDGSYGVFIQCRLGHNTQRRSSNTYYANKAVTDILNKSGLSRKTFYHTEVFKNSKAAQDLRDSLKGIEDPKLFTAYREVVQNYLNIADDESNVLAVTHVVYAHSRIAKDELGNVVKQVMNAMLQDETVYREVTILTYEEIVEFLQRYYRLEVLDMGLIRAHIAERKNGVNCPVHILKLYGRSGKIYTREEFKKLSLEILEEGGLEIVNN